MHIIRRLATTSYAATESSNFIKNPNDCNTETTHQHCCHPQSALPAWRAVCTRALKYSPRHYDTRLLVIPTSCSQLSDCNSNLGCFWGFALTHVIASYCNNHCSTCVAQSVSDIQTWRHPHFMTLFASSPVIVILNKKY